MLPSAPDEIALGASVCPRPLVPTSSNIFQPASLSPFRDRPFLAALSSSVATLFARNLLSSVFSLLLLLVETFQVLYVLSRGGSKLDFQIRETWTQNLTRSRNSGNPGHLCFLSFFLSFPRSIYLVTKRSFNKAFLREIKLRPSVRVILTNRLN